MMYRPVAQELGRPGGQELVLGLLAQPLREIGEEEAAGHRAEEGARPADENEGQVGDRRVEARLAVAPRVDLVGAMTPARPASTPPSTKAVILARVVSTPMEAAASSSSRSAMNARPTLTGSRRQVKSAAAISNGPAIHR